MELAKKICPEEAMLSDEKSAKIAVAIFIFFMIISAGYHYMEGKLGASLLSLSLILIFYWSLLNPWILQEKYSPLLFLDYQRMVHKPYLMIGLVALAVSGMMIFFG